MHLIYVIHTRTHTHTHTHSVSYSFPPWLSQDTEYSAPCSTGGPCLSILHRTVCIKSFLSALALDKHKCVLCVCESLPVS